GWHAKAQQLPASVAGRPFPGRPYGMPRSRPRWPTRRVAHPTDTAPPPATEPEDEPVPVRCTNRRAVGAFPGRRSACTAAALGGQRETLTTLPIPRCPAATEPQDEQSPIRCTNVGRSALFPAADRHAPQPRSVANAKR